MAKGEKAQSLQEAMEMADDYTLARRGNKAGPRKPFSNAGGGVSSDSRMDGRASHPATLQRAFQPEEGRSRINLEGRQEVLSVWEMGAPHV